jgi:HAE1 family hydrophobic/amphiphilic exporter-1
MGYDWAGMAFQEVRVRGGQFGIFAIAVLLVYLVLAAQYESWLTPLAVILIVPLGVLGAVVAVAVRGMDNNLYTQIGIVLIIALASKNAILIVEFARDIHATGKSPREAAVEAARLRLRPILMTSFAFILGCLPLWFAAGSGAASRRILGTVVVTGMLAATLIAIFIIPLLFVLVERLTTRRSSARAASPDLLPGESRP